MPECNVLNRTIFERDNIEVMRGIDAETIDLIYLDPPFNSNQNYAAPTGSEAAGAAFVDTWELSDADNEWHADIEHKNKALYYMLHTAELMHSKSMKSYLIMMTVRLMEMKRILKQTGSIYLHCDPHASHYIKLIMDHIFGKNNFRNEIIWKRANAKNNAKKRGQIHDTIFYYVKSEKSTWNKIYEEYGEDYLQKRFKNKDAHGYFGVSEIMRVGTTDSNSETSKEWKGIDPTDFGRIWIPPRDGFCADYIEKYFIPNYKQIKGVHARLDALDTAGLIYWRKKGKIPGIKYYKAGSPGKTLQDLILNINYVTGKEKTNYPTQKPLALLEQIIQSSSNPGDLVLDPFCGCATACVAAEKLGRKWIGIDLSNKAVELVKTRIKKEFGLDEQKGILGSIIHRTDIPKHTEKLPHPKVHKSKLYGEQNGNCNGCGTHFVKKEHFDIDHIVPRSKGGTDHYDNLQLLCGHCNSIKGAKSQAEFKVALRDKYA